MEYKDFTSLPPEQEKTFVVYERVSNEAGKKALTLGMICGGVIGLFAIILFLSFDAPENVHAAEPIKELKEEKVVPKKVAPAPVEAVAPTQVDPAAATEAAARTEAPVPPKGATKAPPTALIKE